MALDNFSSLWQIYIDVIAGLTRNPWWRTQSALQRDGCRVKPGMTTLIKSPDRQAAARMKGHVTVTKGVKAD
jgi:hypothetical protein